MTTKVKKLKALLGLTGTSDPVLLKQLNAAHDGIMECAPKTGEVLSQV